MRVSAKGQVTIPAEIRERLGIHPNSEVEFVVRGPDIVLKSCGETREAWARRVVEEISGTATSGLATDEIMTLMRGEPDE